MSESKLTLYYSVENCGDGSAYPRFFDSEALAEWHQEYQNEGWGEPCTGDITIEGTGLSCLDMQTKEGMYLKLLLDRWGSTGAEKLEDFVHEFFPDGLPAFSVKILDANYYGIFVGSRFVHKAFAYPEEATLLDGATKLLHRIIKGRVEDEEPHDGKE